MVTTGGRGTRFRTLLAALGRLGGFLGRLLFEGDDFGLGPEEARHLAGQFGVERLVDGGEDAAHHQASNQVLGANAELLRQVLHRDALGDRDVLA